MSDATPCRADLTEAYESLRAQATGEAISATPRGLALLLHSGLPDWMRTWSPLTRPPLPVSTQPQNSQPSVTHNVELVRLLTDMALGGLAGGRS